MSKTDRESLAEAMQQLAVVKQELEELKRARPPASPRFSTLDNVPWPVAVLGAATIAAVAIFAVRGRPPALPQGPSTESTAPAPAPGEYNPPPQAGPPPTPPSPPAPTPDPPAPTPENGSGPPPSAIADAIRAIYPATTACVPGNHPNIGVGFDFVSSGSVGDVRITGTVTETQRACILSAVRGAHVPPFLAERFQAEFAF